MIFANRSAADRLDSERNPTKAAQKLYISQPTLTKYITRLEQDLGVQLFVRSVQPIRIAHAGHAFTICRREGHEIAFALMVRCLRNMLNLR